MAYKYVYLFSEGNGSMRELLGGKGANLAEMTNIGLPVPQGFIISTEACTRYYEDNESIAPEIEAEIFEYLHKIEEINDKKLGDPAKPLLVSVRSGARASMPGMMDTILNLGINDEVAAGLIAGNSDPKFERFVYDSYRRFVQMYSDVVMGLSKKRFETIIDEIKEKKGVKQDIELDTEDLKEMLQLFREFYKKELGEEFPQDPNVQLMGAVKAVFRSWNNERAIFYRKMNEIPSSWGTAVSVMPMVFGNLNNNSGTGVAFTRNPATGEKGLFGEFLMNAQGEDVVAGVRTPSSIDELAQTNPDVYKQFSEIANRLENHYRDMQDMEFTIENGKLYMLQTRNGKRTAAAALRVACDLVDEGMISKEEALLMVDPKQLDALLHPQFDADALKKATVVASALPASPGAACGQVVFSAEEAIEEAAKGNKVILVRLETSPEDIEGMHVSQGILTVRGGMTSHAAVVARGMGTCCVSGCGDINMHDEEGYFEVFGHRVNRGDYISLDGSTGNIYLEAIPTVPASLSGNFGRFMGWADEVRTLGVRTNADTPADAKQAFEYGAEGIGLCRTEHMFFETDRIAAIREFIVSKTTEQRKVALAKLLPMQQGDFEQLYEVMQGKPVTIRFLDPPLHEFVPTNPEDIENLANTMNLPVEEVYQTINNLHEFNPMMGHRGCRLAVSYPELAEMQTTAVIQAAYAVMERTGMDVTPEIMIPLVGEIKELQYVKKVVCDTADAIIEKMGKPLHYKVGSMIEIPRAALTADEIAKEAEFFSFGTNDLTQYTFGFSRDDAGKFLNDYYGKNIYELDPFAHLDQDGVGRLMKTAVALGKQTRPDIKLGICGEHGGDPTSIEFCHSIGLTYVSCSPFRVPIARLAAAQAEIKNPRRVQA
ncbi:MAG: pyruvate, phosphate dikinase [Oscillospiraceae bacterium]|nr:pyruvate, phosphate dikinase [Oscillospiraceae bacterium]